MNIEKITVDGKNYVPVKEYNHASCLGCDFYSERCTARNVCKCFGENVIMREEGTSRPTLTDYTTIRSYNDACIALRRAPLTISDLHDIGDSTIAMLLLETIAEAIRGKEGPILFDSSAASCVYAPCFGRYTGEEMDVQDDVLRKSALWVHTGAGIKDIFAMSHIARIETNGYKCFNPRIMQHSYEKAQYLGGRHFIHLWAIYFGLIFDYDDFFIKKPI